MKQYTKLLTSVALAVLSTSVLAATTVPVTIGVVDVPTVFNASKSVQQQKAKLASNFKSKRDNLMAQQKQLQTMIDEYRRNKTVMSKEELQKLQTQISAQQSKLLQLSQMYSQQADEAQAEAMKTFVGQLKVAAQKVAKVKGLTMVLPESSVIYFDQTEDVTQAVEQQINS